MEYLSMLVLHSTFKIESNDSKGVAKFYNILFILLINCYIKSICYMMMWMNSLVCDISMHTGFLG
jgi:hypothetical protein